MNSVIIFCVLLVCGQQAVAKKSDANPLLFFSQQSPNDCKSSGLQCKDCQTIQYCSSNLESIFEVQCEAQSRLRPYCDVETNTCVKDKPSVCNLPETSFHCPGTGYYPDLENCANYYMCDEYRVATQMSCPLGSNWDQALQACRAYFCRSYSPKLGQCKGKTNKLVAYSGDKNMYVLCLTNGPILFQCPNKWEVFDEAEVTCKFECTQNGFFPNPSEPRKFYSCTKVGKGYESVTLECPEGYEFVELGVGQGICTYRTTTTTTTTEVPTTIEVVATTTVNEEENQTEAPEEPENQTEEAENQTEEAENQTEEAENQTEVAEEAENQTEAAEEPENQTEAAEEVENQTEAAEEAENQTEAAEETENHTEVVEESAKTEQPENHEEENKTYRPEEIAVALESESNASGENTLTEETVEESTNEHEDISTDESNDSLVL